MVDDSRVSEGLMPGDCVCRPGFGGSDCSQCALGYFGYPNCQPCPCNVAGTVDPNNCEGRCDCKVRSAYQHNVCLQMFNLFCCS